MVNIIEDWDVLEEYGWGKAWFLPAPRQRLIGGFPDFLEIETVK